MAVILPRCLVRLFRAVLRKLIPPRRASPFVLIATGPEGLTLLARHEHLGLRYRLPEPHPAQSIKVPGDVLAKFEGRDSTTVRLEEVSPGTGLARWQEGGVQQECEIPTVLPEIIPPLPDVPKPLASMPAGFLDALADAARTAARDSTRVALCQVLLRGSRGEMVGTDGRQLLLQRGFAFPWREDLLVPALPVFGARELASGAQPGVGLSEEHVIVQVGPWTLWLPVDRHSRFPDVDRVVPSSESLPTLCNLDSQDAAFLENAIPKLPGKEDKFAPITLDLGKAVAVRARDSEQGVTTEVLLPRCRVSGPAVRLVMNRCFLLRLLQLGFSQMRAGKPSTPLLCQEGSRRYLWMPLEGEGAVPPTRNARQLRPQGPDTEPATPPKRRPAMPPPSNESRPARNGAGPTPPSVTTPDPVPTTDLIAEAETLRTLLHEAHARVGRLIAALKQQRRQTRAVQAAVASLRQLQQLGP